MYCLKCGKETRDGSVFCESCLAVMKQFPVKPGTPVHLHVRTAAAKKAPPRKKVLTPEEQLPRLRETVKRLSLCLTAAILVLVLITAMLIHTVNTAGKPAAIGQNYHTAGTAEKKD